MAPKMPNRKSAAKKRHNLDNQLAGGAEPPPTITIDYAEVQNEEVGALQAIYMDDYEEVETKGAWSKSSDKAFRLTLRALSDPETFVVLSVRLTATYPKTAPILALDISNGLREKTRTNVEKILQTKPRDLMDEVMIYEIATNIQDLLEDEVQHKAEGKALPTLEEERAEREAVTAELAKRQEEEEAKKKDAEKAEEERVLQQMVHEEVARRKAMTKKTRRSAAALSPIPHDHDHQVISFDHTIPFQCENGSIIFSAVRQIEELESGPFTENFKVQPLAISTDDNTDQPSSYPRLVVKVCRFNKQTPESKRKMLSLEGELESIKQLPAQPNCLKVLEFKIDQDPSGWEVFILTEFANRGTLHDVLGLIQIVPIGNVRSWTLDLLEALEFYHRHGIIHKRIHTGNVLHFLSSTGSPVVKLADSGFQQTIHDFYEQSKKGTASFSARSAYWISPELTDNEGAKKTRKTDVWDLGVVFLQMLFGLSTPQKYKGPLALLESQEISESLEDIMRKFFKSDPKRRPSAFDLIPSEFFRDIPETTTTNAAQTPQFSRYASEWIEIGRLGRGGFGEVVKARNKLDGQIYAIKKITQRATSAATLTEVLSEVMLLSRLNHPNVVRYYSVWPEHEFDPGDTEESTISTTEENRSTPPTETHGIPGSQSLDFVSSTGGLDFISSSGYPKIVFGDDSDSSDDDEDAITESGEDQESQPDTSTSKGAQKLAIKRTLSSSQSTRPTRSTLYIQMEYCERLTLRDIIRRGLDDSPDEMWRLFRQILQGLAHIHSHGIIHRDLKPDNIFIDVTDNPKIGDFGLATSGQYHSTNKHNSNNSLDPDMTRSIGTTFYVAPELKSEARGSYNEKVDMYSVGIILFEMCYPLRTAMERAQVIGILRQKEHQLPATLRSPEKTLQCSLIESLVSHRPSERPSCGELLRSGKIPFQVEDAIIQQALNGLSDPSSPQYHKMMTALFSMNPNRLVQDYTWDMSGATSSRDSESDLLILQATVKDQIGAIFRRHGAIEIQRQLLIPHSTHYTNRNVVRLLDSSGTLLQLPFDLTLPNARVIARKLPVSEKTFSFGNVYRDTFSGGAPASSREADFDVVTTNTLDFALKEAEVLKVLDEIVQEFPPLATSQMCFHLNHSDLLDMIMEFSRISPPQRPAVIEVLSKLNIHENTWSKVRNELRAPSLGVPSTSLDDLARFDFRDTPERAFVKLRSIFGGSEYLNSTPAIFSHLHRVVGYMKEFDIRSKVYICPLSCFNEKFYKGGVLFQCIFDSKRRDVLAAGGRYDRLIEEYRPRGGQGEFTGCHAVGMNLGWDRVVTSMARFQKGKGKSKTFLKKAAPGDEEQNNLWAPRRCDVLVAAFDSTVLRSAGVRMVADLWANDISAELAQDARSPEDLLSHHRDDKYSWIVIIKHDPVAGKADLKVKSLLTKQDADINRENLIAHVRAELRDREHREGLAERSRVLHHRSLLGPTQSGNMSGGDVSGAGFASDRRPNVHVLVGQHRPKKSNRGTVIEAALSRVQSLLASYAGAPIAAVETADDVLEMVRGTRLSDAESWRKVVQAVPAGDRQYVQQVQGILERFRGEWKETGGCRMAFVFNFRTGWMTIYDLGL